MILRRAFALTPVALSLLVAVALAAVPRAGGTYRGQSSSHHALSIKVARRPVRPGVFKGVLKYCGRTVRIYIVHGFFGIHLTEAGGAVSDLRMSGFFRTQRLVKGRIDLDFTSGSCSRPGTWTATLK